MPVAESERHIRAAERLSRRDNIKHGKFTDAFGVVERQAVGTPSAAVMPSHVELLEAEIMHQRNLIACHDALGIRHVVRSALWFAALAVAAQVRGDHRKILREPGGKRVPHHVRLRVSVKEQQRRSTATMADPQRYFLKLDPG